MKKKTYNRRLAITKLLLSGIIFALSAKYSLPIISSAPNNFADLYIVATNAIAAIVFGLSFLECKEYRQCGPRLTIPGSIISGLFIAGGAILLGTTVLFTIARDRHKFGDVVCWRSFLVGIIVAIVAALWKKNSKTQ